MAPPGPGSLSRCQAQAMFVFHPQVYYMVVQRQHYYYADLSQCRVDTVIVVVTLSHFNYISHLVSTNQRIITPSISLTITVCCLINPLGSHLNIFPGVPNELSAYWHQYPYPFGELFCKIRSFLSEG